MALASDLTLTYFGRVPLRKGPNPRPFSFSREVRPDPELARRQTSKLRPLCLRSERRRLDSELPVEVVEVDCYVRGQMHH